MSVLVSPSILAADKDHIEEEIALAERNGADWLHIDVMDGVFVPAKTFDPAYVKKVCDSSSLFHDVHLMVASPLKEIPLYAEAGADLLTFHYEALPDDSRRHEAISLIHSLHKKAGISIKPNTPASVLLPFWDELELILVMSVEPGKGGQAFLPSALEKLSFFQEENQRNSHHVLLEVDGGINEKTAPLAKQAGAAVLVAGSYLYGHEDFASRVEELKK